MRSLRGARWMTGWRSWRSSLKKSPRLRCFINTSGLMWRRLGEDLFLVKGLRYGSRRGSRAGCDPIIEFIHSASHENGVHRMGILLIFHSIFSFSKELHINSGMNICSIVSTSFPKRMMPP